MSLVMSDKKELYFGPEVDEAIIQFLSDTNTKRRNKLFEEKIYPAFDKLSRYHYHKFPLAKNEEVISECVAFLYEQLHKFDSTKNTRGFPYFNIIAKNFYIGKLKNQNKEVSHDISVSLSDCLNSSDTLLVEDMEERIEKDEFIQIFKEYLPIWKDKFTKQHEKDLANALIEMFEEPDAIDIYKKKAIFLYLKEQTGLNSKQIAVNLNKIKKKFEFLKMRYNRGDF